MAEVKRIRDKAEALRDYIRKSGESKELVNVYAEVKVRAERRAGQILKETVRDSGRPSEKYSHDGKISLAEMGIDGNQSSRWQSLALIPEFEFEGFIGKIKSRAVGA